jgi:hypothetical protein
MKSKARKNHNNLEENQEDHNHSKRKKKEESKSQKIKRKKEKERTKKPRQSNKKSKKKITNKVDTKKMINEKENPEVELKSKAGNKFSQPQTSSTFITYISKNKNKKPEHEWNTELIGFKPPKNNKKLSQKIQDELTYLNENNNLPEIQMDDKPRTILEIMNDVKSGTPMSSEIRVKKLRKKNKLDSLDNSETFSILNSEISGYRSEKPFLRNKSNRDSSSHNTISNNITSEPNYSNFFKPKLKWCPLTNKMIIEKPTYQEASMKMQEEIMKNENSFIHHNSDSFKLTSSSFKKTLHTDKWTDEETRFFYKALECFGTDFSFLEIVLKPRNRSQIKNKFRKEERENALKIESALKKHDPKNLMKILNVFREFKEEMTYKNSKKINKRKTNNQQNTRDFDFKKLIMTNDTEDQEYNLSQMIQEISAGNEQEEDIIDKEEDSEPLNREEEEEKTVSVIYESSEEVNEDFEENEYSNLKVYYNHNKSKHDYAKANNIVQKDAPINSSTIKTSKVKVIINEGNEQNNEDNEVKENKVTFSFDFLKSFNN